MASTSTQAVQAQLSVRRVGYTQAAQILVGTASIGIAAYLIAKSWNWPIALDIPLMHYVALLIDHGKVPYRDILDFNSPGTYLFHWLAIHLFGSGDLGWRMFDLFFLGLGSVSIFMVTRPKGIFAGVFGSSVLIGVHIAKGITEMGQRDFLLGILALCACAMLMMGLRTGSKRWWFACGFLCALAATIKVNGIAFLVGFLAFALTVQRTEKKPLRPVIVWTLIGAALPLIGFAIYLAMLGALEPLLRMYVEFLPVYRRLQQMPGAQLALYMLIFLSPLAPLLYAGLCSVVLYPREALSREQLALLTGAACGIATYWSQSKGFPYHIDPALIFLSVWATSAIAVMLKGRERAGHFLLVLLLIYCVAFSVPQAIKAVKAERYPLRPIRQLESEITELRASGKANGIQAMDTANGCLQALYDLRLVQSTGFIYDFYLYQVPENPYVQGLRSRFLGEMHAHPPDLIVMSNGQFPDRHWGFERIEKWPEFRDFLQANYHLERQHHWYRIYVHN